MPNDAMVGADPQQLDALARDMKAAADRLASIQVTLRGQVHTAPWQGRRADTFRSDWDGAHRAALAAAGNALTQAAEQLRANAADQRQASSAGSAGPGGSAGGGGGGGGGGSWGSSGPGGRSGSVGTSGNLGPVSYNGGVSGSVLTGSTSKEWSMSGPTYDVLTGTWTPAQAGVNVGAKYAVVEGSVQGSAGAGPVKVSGQGSVFVGGKAGAEAKVTAGPDGVGAHAGANAFAGATASASATGGLYGQSATATAQAYAGIGVKADADLEISYTHVKGSLELGAALGVGAGYKVSIDLDPMAAAGEVTKHLPKLW